MKIEGLFAIGASSLNVRYCVAKLPYSRRKHAYVIYDTKIDKPVCERHALYAENTRAGLETFLANGKRLPVPYKGAHPLCLVCHRYAQIGATLRDVSENYASHFDEDLKRAIQEIFGLSISSSSEIYTQAGHIDLIRKILKGDPVNHKKLGSGTYGAVYRLNEKYAVKIMKVEGPEAHEAVLDAYDVYTMTQRALVHPHIKDHVAAVYPGLHLKEFDPRNPSFITDELVMAFSELVAGSSFYNQMSLGKDEALLFIDTVINFIEDLGAVGLYHGDPNLDNMIGIAPEIYFWKAIDFTPRRKTKYMNFMDAKTNALVHDKVSGDNYIMDYVRLLYYFIPRYKYDPMEGKWRHKYESTMSDHLGYALDRIKKKVDNPKDISSYIEAKEEKRTKIKDKLDITSNKGEKKRLKSKLNEINKEIDQLEKTSDSVPISVRIAKHVLSLIKSVRAEKNTFVETDPNSKYPAKYKEIGRWIVDVAFDK